MVAGVADASGYRTYTLREADGAVYIRDAKQSGINAKSPRANVRELALSYLCKKRWSATCGSVLRYT